VQTQSIRFREQSFGSALEIAAAAHDLRNRVGIAGCEIHLLRQRITQKAETAFTSEYLASVERTLHAASDQLEGLLELIRARASLQPGPETPRLDLVEFVTRLVAQRRSTHGPHDLVFLTATPEITGAWDERRLCQAVTSLLRNALDYSLGRAHVVVTLQREGNLAVLRIADRGIGIPASDLPHVFQPFYRARNAESVCAGLGLGLATARLIVEQYGGTIEAESIEGHGATFTLRLPLPEA
jgi:signal transduction histidine kinase